VGEWRKDQDLDANTEKSHLRATVEQNIRNTDWSQFVRMSRLIKFIFYPLFLSYECAPDLLLTTNKTEINKIQILLAENSYLN
jgi:hypothetical protein